MFCDEGAQGVGCAQQRAEQKEDEHRHDQGEVDDGDAVSGAKQAVQPAGETGSQGPAVLRSGLQHDGSPSSKGSLRTTTVAASGNLPSCPGSGASSPVISRSS